MDTATPHGELLFFIFGALAQYERALTRERVLAGLAAAKRRGRQGGRRPVIDAEKMEAITAALAGGASKAAVCRNFGIARSTLLGTLERIGWTAPPKDSYRSGNAQFRPLLGPAILHDCCRWFSNVGSRPYAVVGG